MMPTWIWKRALSVLIGRMNNGTHQIYRIHLWRSCRTGNHGTSAWWRKSKCRLSSTKANTANTKVLPMSNAENSHWLICWNNSHHVYHSYCTVNSVPWPPDEPIYLPVCICWNIRQPSCNIRWTMLQYNHLPTTVSHQTDREVCCLTTYLTIFPSGVPGIHEIMTVRNYLRPNRKGWKPPKTVRQTYTYTFGTKRPLVRIQSLRWKNSQNSQFSCEVSDCFLFLLDRSL